MNWGSGSVDAVAKERIWREHVTKQKTTARIHEEFRCNPLKKDPPTSEPVNKRPARFLDRSAVIMEMLEKRLSRVKKNEDRETQFQKQLASTRSGLGISAGSSARAPDSPRAQFQLQTRGMYGDSARGLQKPASLPPILPAASSTAASASGRQQHVSPRGGGAPTDFDHLFASAQLTPRDKYAIPQTSNQEVGWWNKPLVTQRELEPRFRYGLSQCELTRNGSQFVGSRKN